MARNELPRRDQVIDLLRAHSRALHAREIAELLGVREGDYLRFLGVLEQLTFDKAVRSLPGQRFRATTGTAELREGTISVHPKGFGFVACPGQASDLFIPENAMGGAMHGDTVRARVAATTKRGAEGVVEAVLQRALSRVQGVLRMRGASAWLEPDDARIRGPIVVKVPEEGRDGLAAVAEIIRFPERREENPEGSILAVLGEPGDPAVEMRKVLLREHIEEAFPTDAERQASEFPETIPEDALVGRRDLRGIDLVTIDPDDARDHDDAVWAQEDGGSFEVWVAIADVAHHVSEGSAIDSEAKRRAFSIYLPDRAVPMLPGRLSSNLCSLREGVDRLCMAVRFRCNRRGAVRDVEVVEGVMRSRARLTYTGIARSMGWTANEGEARLSEDLLQVIEASAKLASILRRQRLRRGALDLKVAEPHVLLDKGNAAPKDVVRRAQDPGERRAYSVIEELMVAANEAIARWIGEHEFEAIYRVHAPPDEAKLEKLVEICAALDLQFEFEDAIDPKRFSAFLERIAEHPLAENIGGLALRSLKQATYDQVNIGHFGLASKAYAHFTSPIRRYPDLVVHRLVKRVLHAQQGLEREVLREIAAYCSRRERTIASVEREIVDLYRALLMREHIGETLEGRVAEIDDVRVVIALDHPFVHVRVPLDRLGSGVYEASKDGLRAVEVRSGDTIRLGDRASVRVEDVSLVRRQVLGTRICTNKTPRTSATRPAKLAPPRRRSPKPLTSRRKSKRN